jgi:hypothetical protein
MRDPADHPNRGDASDDQQRLLQGRSEVPLAARSAKAAAPITLRIPPSRVATTIHPRTGIVVF